MLDAAASSRVGSEFVGLARVFRDTVRREDEQLEHALRAAIARAAASASEVAPGETPLGVIHAWANMPSLFRIGHPKIAYVRTEFAIEEQRLCVSWIRDEGWGEAAERERGLAVCKLTFRVQDGRLIRRWRPIANVSLHALARRIERGAGRDPVALFSDLATLAQGNDTGERIDTPGGFWLGGCIEALDDGAGKGCKLRNVRTWLPVDSEKSCS
jgi:hypothetical protein